MNLLPKTKEEFSRTDYWDSFFRNRGSKSFEWYGEYHDLYSYLNKYIKKSDNILITGCGNSDLGANLHDAGFKDITNIDTSKVVIKQMKEKYKEKTSLAYLQMDALDTTFENENFNVILDKGTLDALMPDCHEATLKNIRKYFEEINRITKISGRYICISLLQEHILQIILEYFPSNNWMFRVIRCLEAEQNAVNNGEKLTPVFIVICIKFKSLQKQILEVNMSSNDKMQRFESIDQVKEAVLNTQRALFICSSLQQRSIEAENEVSFDLYEADSSKLKYTVYVVDIIPDKKNTSYAAFIVPQGRESEWLFSTKNGRKKLASISRCNRLLVVTMHRGLNYGSIEDIQKDLGDIIRDTTPVNSKNNKIPCLSLGEDGIGSRQVIHEGFTKTSGGYIIEDVEMEKKKYRRLYFLSNQLVIQSEAKLISYKNRKGILKDKPDLTNLTCTHHFYMVLAASIACDNERNASVAVLGVGGGGLCSFLNKYKSKMRIIGVEIDPEIIEIATNWFGLQRNNTLEIRCQDGLRYLKEVCDEGSTLNAVLFDIDNKDSSIGMSCPPKEFLEEEVLDNVRKIIAEAGLFILNMVIRDESLLEPLVNKLKEKFKRISSFKNDEELNEIYICSNRSSEISKEQLTAAVNQLNAYFKKNNNSDQVLDLNHDILDKYINIV
ncbi:eEF1A lysine and N-terminal methyltransferase homolog [Coccinella septempunctata]|uniref:eEF1A lysine and N-terminal methyltransferase homolog n=1 Tax=Coccinella septempunctata TaxID=41139 RepID=UPI001D086F39|nr:eEF1A lysine and N-terminal methyltransferase homolog [Coccinella septempunctata]